MDNLEPITLRILDDEGKEIFEPMNVFAIPGDTIYLKIDLSVSTKLVRTRVEPSELE